MRGKTVIFSIVMLVLGFLISFSYQYTKQHQADVNRTEQWKKEYSLKSQLAKQEKANQKLEKELYSLQSKVQATESNLKNKKEKYFNVLEDVEKYRMFTGEIGVKGKGVKVSLEDASYIPSGQNVNNYIVHESHIFNVINELFISGASAVAVNGQRITHQSYIHCNGPVVIVDGVQHPAPFVISAIGDPTVLIPALNIAGGAVDQLTSDHISVTIEKKDIHMKPLLRSKD
ncbi:MULTISPECIES: DUF881 domain-containing protein [unclassified Bacillus (in: firmicutes)]|uniref:DUF881 domain-containing protein n=1 Tax=Bacillus TaxID=1386 RepID=UPI00338F3CB9